MSKWVGAWTARMPYDGLRALALLDSVGTTLSLHHEHHHRTLTEMLQTHHSHISARRSLAHSVFAAAATKLITLYLKFITQNVCRNSEKSHVGLNRHDALAVQYRRN
jgi:hypothetical protein